MRKADRDTFSFYLGTKVVHGLGSVRETGAEFKALGATKALVVTDKGVMEAGLVDEVIRSLEGSGISFAVYDQVEEDPGAATVAKGAELALSRGCDGIVVIGGGSPICAGRAIGVVATNGGSIGDYAGIDKARKSPLPLIAIPTTAGSGAEVSQFILLKDEERHTKMVVGSSLFFPRVAILDATLLKALPFRQAVASGVDALGHAIEAYLTTFTTPITDALALQAVSMIFHNLRAAATSDDVDAKEACLIGSTMANIACGNARLGLVHLMANPLEGMFRISHGIAVGTLLPHVMEFNRPACMPRFASLGRAMGESQNGRTTDELACGALTAFKKLLSDLNFPRKYPEPEVDRSAAPKMAAMAMGGPYGFYDPHKEYSLDAVVPSPNIRKATVGDLIYLHERAFEGWD